MIETRIIKSDVLIVTISIIRKIVADTLISKKQRKNFELNISRRNREKRSWMRWKKLKKNELIKKIKISKKNSISDINHDNDRERKR